MRKKVTYLVVFLAAVTLAAVFYAKKAAAPGIRIDNTAAPEALKNEDKETAPSGKKNFFVAGWLPYWAKVSGTDSLEGKMNLFSEVNLFAFGVDSEGNLRDTAKIDAAPWPKLREDAEREHVSIVPTILWGDAGAMHKVFSDTALTDRHIDAIISMLSKNDFSGVDIDYEGKDVADRDNFSSFIEALHKKLGAAGKTLSCTVEARTQDAPPAGFSGVRAMSWSNDFSVLNDSCDRVRMMAYDEVFQVHRAQTFSDTGETPFAPNADIRWVGDVAGYALKYIAPEKLVLGIPTYGWEFSLEKIPAGYRYTRFKSVSYGEAVGKAAAAGVAPARDAGGEISFVYPAAGGKHLVTFSDAEAMRQKIELAEGLHLAGISFFKIDGLSDPQFFDMLVKEAE